MAQQRVQTSGGIIDGPPKSAASRRTIAQDAESVRLLRALRREQLQAGPLPKYAFLSARGAPLRPDYLTARFHDLVVASGLPPIRLHDLRHGAASLALAAHTDLQVVQGMLGHSSIMLTADTYTSVLPTVCLEATDASAKLVLAAARKTSRRLRWRCRAEAFSCCKTE
ncbi:phage integrase family protein [Nonomuraea fuscirosea]|uniref:Phage integrase family protein n=1 Tax=Nonomuraea fuscirosea TaxID=1291556 RepID=A0A2T0N7V9_9ACTN|nr:phage integrase family protein [Nonomuraea fuscirosea]